MTFRSIGTLASDVLAKAKIEVQGRGSSDERAPAPAYPVTGMRVATDAGEGVTPVAFAQSGGRRPAEQTELGKMGEPKPPRVVQGGGQSEDRRANKGHSSTLRLIYSSKSACIAKSNRQRPTVAAMHPHLVLCVSH